MIPQHRKADLDKMCVQCDHKVREHTIEGWCMCVDGDVAECPCPGLMFDVHVTPKKTD